MAGRELIYHEPRICMHAMDSISLLRKRFPEIYRAPKRGVFMSVLPYGRSNHWTDFKGIFCEQNRFRSFFKTLLRLGYILDVPVLDNCGSVMGFSCTRSGLLESPVVSHREAVRRHVSPYNTKRWTSSGRSHIGHSKGA